MRQWYTLSVVFVILAGIGVGGQQPVDLSGTWDAKALALNAGGVAGGSVIYIEQTPDTIKIRRSYGREALTNPPVVLTIRLDGSESPNAYHFTYRPGLTGSLTSRAKWNGSSLVIVTTHTLYDVDKKTSSKTETTETFSREGSRLTVVRSVSPSAGEDATEIWIRR